MKNLSSLQRIKQADLGMQLNSRMSAKQWTDSSTFPEPPEYDDLDDARVLRYLFRNFAPRRHLEFGTWKGKGARRVLEECEDAVVWTVNLWEGEYKQDGTWAYAGKQDGKKVRTDAGGMIGIEYLQAGLGNRVNQIYSDSRLWDDTVYPDGFFDSVFVDGGHDAATSRADLYRALRLLRPGGLLLLHDFSPSGEVHAQFPSTAGVSCMVAEELENIAACCEEFFHVEDTWLFCAIRRREATGEQALREVELIREAREKGKQQALAESAQSGMLGKRPNPGGIWETYGEIKQQRDNLLRSKWMKLGFLFGLAGLKSAGAPGGGRKTFDEIARQRDSLLRSRWRRLGLMFGLTRKFKNE